MQTHRTPNHHFTERYANIIVGLLLLTLIVAIAAIMTRQAYSEPTSDTIVTPRIDMALPTAVCPGSDGQMNCIDASPAIADINGDGNPDIVAATFGGHVSIVDGDGTVIWDVDLAPLFDLPPGEQRLRASPAVGDVDGDGYPNIVIATGSVDHDPVCRPGGVIVLDHLGRKLPGWPQLATPDSDGCPYSYFSSPALGDLDKDGDLEIVIGGFDKRLLALHHDGTLLPNFPIDSYHAQRFPAWGNLRGRLADSIWSSPALADIDGDSYLDIIIGTDEGNFDERYGGDSGGWECPYELPSGWTPGYCGGSVYVVDRFGQHLPGFPKYVPETVQSSPAIADLTGDNLPEIIVGTGTFYHNHSPESPTIGFRVFAWQGNGTDAPGWEDGIVTSGSTSTSPTIGNVTGDSKSEVVILDNSGELHVWHRDGSAAAGFPMTPLTTAGSTHGYDIDKAVVLADYDGKDVMEIVVAMNGSISIVDGDGTLLTTTDIWGSPLPAYQMPGSVGNVPAVADLNNDGVVDLIVHNSLLRVWSLDLARNVADWPMHGHDAARTASQPTGITPEPVIDPESILLQYQIGSGAEISTVIDITFDPPDAMPRFTWVVSTSSSRVMVSPPTGSTIADSKSLDVMIDTDSLPTGVQDLGTITLDIDVTDETGTTTPYSFDIPVSIVVGDFVDVYLPVLMR
jgi:hypothetical protein